jgi:putative membrane-bound dehydrogenase-like protein
MRRLGSSCTAVLAAAIAAGMFVLRGAAPTSSPAASQPAIPDSARGAAGLDAAVDKLHAPTRGTAPLPPPQSWAKLKPVEGLAVDLIAAEPVVRQPLCINFDSRGRMWVTQYIQYPMPAGLKVVEYDNYLRARFDLVPLPPPRGTPGHDRITVLEDVNGDGSYAKATAFVDGLNIATSALPDRDGVWVMNPPYLLFYPDINHDDVPDGNPIVHLSGFGLEDTHAVASSLTFGPDGWIYGAVGSTTTSKIKAELSPEPQRTMDFLGQAIWRYHPTRHVFELFAEGGGNTFGVAFDAPGRLYSGTNWGTYRGLHYVQGGYYLKNWGKHGPLTNPFAFGYFEHMPHTGDAQRLTHTFAVYDGGLLPAKYEGALIGPNPLMSRVQVTKLVPNGSTYKTIEQEPLVTSDDGWFRPVDAKVGPDGAVYVADFYENRISHVDPRDNWDRTTGRIYRVRPADWKPGIKPFDVTKMSGVQLLTKLEDRNAWRRGAARREMAHRDDPTLVAALREKLASGGPAALESLWALHLMGKLDDATRLAALAHREPAIQAWAVRLIGDDRELPADSIVARVTGMATGEADPQVRSQLASTVRRLPASVAMPVLREMFARDGDAADPHIPLLLWWAVEPLAVSHRDSVLEMFGTTELWEKAIVRQTILPRLARRWAAEPTPENQTALLQLIRAATGDAERKILFAGINEAFEGREIPALLPALAGELARSGSVDLALRGGDSKVHAEALRIIATEDAKLLKQRLHYIELIGQVGRPEAADTLLNVAATTRSDPVRRAALAAIGRFGDPALGQRLVALYPRLASDQAARSTIITLLVTRPAWTTALLTAVESGAIAKPEIPASAVERLRHADDAALAGRAQRIFGNAQRAASAEKQQQIDRIRGIVTSAPGDAAAGQTTFTARCAACHMLFGQGGHIGPDLTGYDRRNLDFLLTSTIDPGAYVREEFTAFRVKTTDGRTLEGLITAREEGQITITDTAGQKTVIPRSILREEKALPTSLMPEELLAGLSDKELRDLFAYLMK